MAEDHSKAGGESNCELYYFRCGLHKVSQNLRTENLKELVYICTEIKSTEHITKGHDLFLDLEKKGLIMPGNYDYLLDRLLQIGREDLVTHLLEHICRFPHTQWDVANKMLDRLLKTGRDEVAIHFMKWIWKSLLTPSTFPAHLMEHLINSGRGDLVMELMGRMSCLHLPQGLQTERQTMQVVYHAKQSMCASHKAALSMLLYATSPLKTQLSGVFRDHLQEVGQSAGMHPDATFIQWSDVSVCEDSVTFKDILSSTLECIYSFSDAHREMTTTIIKVEAVDVDWMGVSAKTCNSSVDDFNKAHAITQWNPREREAVLHLRNMRKSPGAIHIQRAVRSISSICEGLLCKRMIEEAEARIKDRTFILETAMYAVWCAVPMYRWMQTVIQLVASSKLDLTVYQDIIVKVATEHREPIVRYHNELSQIIGQDAMKKVDSVLKIDEHEMEKSITFTSVQSSFDLERYMVVYWYTYLLQLLVLACDSSADPWKLASKMGEHHCRFYERNSKDVLKCSLEIAKKVLIAVHSEVESFKAELIQQCPESSAERMLLKGLLPPLTMRTDR